MLDFKEEIKKILHCDHFSVDAVERACRLKFGKVPESLFKYRACSDRNFEALIDDKLWCSGPDGFNDPYDCSIHFEFRGLEALLSRVMNATNEEGRKNGLLELFSKEDMEQVVKSSDPLRELSLVVQAKEDVGDTAGLYKSLEKQLNEPRDKLERSFRDGVRIGSLCERSDSMLMWSHYAQNHTGFAVEYDFSLPGYEGLLNSLWPVIYQGEVFDVSDTIWGPKSSVMNECFMIGAATLKSDEWAYEKEWRMVLLRRPVAKGELVSVPRPTAIYVGAHASEKNRIYLSEIAGQKGIPVRYMYKERRRFRMEPRDD